ncbi:dienelactone hydrolase family protein [Maridesulfovibrio sp.]|uniref:dienelactone hydrolase family protein n=1 Tax=Maridesulfovibrio sp. TaxID=2795000 RepID=UPI002A188D11|nr:dienelactone hydrolase family protein [Maridesulfovibrio sp.]
MTTRSKTVRQFHEGIELEHVLISPAEDGPHPAVLLIHEYTGLDKATLGHAERLAEAGFTVLAADFYGRDNLPADIEQARSIHRLYRNDRLLMRKRACACLQTLLKCPEADSDTVFALGFSFGGGCALELARTGANLKGAVSVYGYLDTTHPAAAGDVKCPLLAIYVENDPVVPEEHLLQFKGEINDSEIVCRIIRVKDSKHGFAKPDSDCFDARQAEQMWSTVLEWMKQSPGT